MGSILMDAIDACWTLALAALLLGVAAHVAVLTFLRPKDPFIFINRAMVVLAVAVFCGALFFFPQMSRGWWQEDPPYWKSLAQSFGILAFLFLPFLSFYGIVEHAVRARILIELYCSREGLALSDLLRQFDPNVETLRRLDELVTGGFLTRHEETFQLTLKGKRMADLALICRSVFKL
ncbi:MAG: hypothetical protein AB1540_03060 [Bdellovibrionota bacterium]